MLLSALREWDRRLEFLCSTDGGGKGSGRVCFFSAEAVKECIRTYAHNVKFVCRDVGGLILVSGVTKAGDTVEYEFEVAEGTMRGGEKGYVVTCKSCNVVGARVEGNLVSNTTESQCMKFIHGLAEGVLKEEKWKSECFDALKNRREGYCVVC
jgi:hypothetical protein